MGACGSRIDYRSAVPEDRAWIVAVVDAWWGRPLARSIPRLFLEHFHQTSFVAEETGTWRFDVKRGRDLSLEMRGILEIDEGRSGSGKFAMKREVTYAEDSRAPKPRDS